MENDDERRRSLELFFEFLNYSRPFETKKQNLDEIDLQNRVVNRKLKVRFCFSSRLSTPLLTRTPDAENSSRKIWKISKLKFNQRRES